MESEFTELPEEWIPIDIGLIRNLSAAQARLVRDDMASYGLTDWRDYRELLGLEHETYYDVIRRKYEEA